jgi:hypothetical protein
MLYDNVPVTQIVPGTPDAVYEFEELDTIFSASVIVNF